MFFFLRHHHHSYFQSVFYRLSIEMYFSNRWTKIEKQNIEKFLIYIEEKTQSVHSLDAWHFISTLKQEEVYFRQPILHMRDRKNKTRSKEVCIMQDRLNIILIKFKTKIKQYVNRNMFDFLLKNINSIGRLIICSFLNAGCIELFLKT